MKVTLKQAFNILDGRLSTEIDDVYEMLNFYTSENLFTHALPRAMDKLEENNPQWFQDGKNLLDKIKSDYDTDDFEKLMKIIDEDFSETTITLYKLNIETSNEKI